jgi:hypothetical protein
LEFTPKVKVIAECLQKEFLIQFIMMLALHEKIEDPSFRKSFFAVLESRSFDQPLDTGSTLV